MKILRILWLEDNPEDIKYLRNLLEEIHKIKFEVVPVISEFLSKLKNNYNNYDIILIDEIVRTISEKEREILGDKDLQREEVGLEVLKKVIEIEKNKRKKKPILIYTVLNEDTYYGRVIYNEVRKLRKKNSQSGIIIDIQGKRYGAFGLWKKIKELLKISERMAK